MVDESARRSEEWLDRVGGIQQWTREGKRAPNKPLLLLQALGRVQDGRGSPITYQECKPDLEALLVEFGPPRKSIKTTDPFVRLAGDDLWVVTTEDRSEPTTLQRHLIEQRATGRLREEDEELLRDDPGLLRETAKKLLAANWPESLHESICERVGLDLMEGQDALTLFPVERSETAAARIRRDPNFRPNVLTAYQYRCAMCGWDGRLGSRTVALEAAHVRWKQYGGDDIVPNGLCLCILHHKLLDLGALGVNEDGYILVSEEFIEGRPSAAAEEVVHLTEKQVERPQKRKDWPAPRFVTWHRDEVFRGPARERRVAGAPG